MVIKATARRQGESFKRIAMEAKYGYRWFCSQRKPSHLDAKRREDRAGLKSAARREEIGRTERRRRARWIWR
jgi:hypothetical protein